MTDDRRQTALFLQQLLMNRTDNEKSKKAREEKKSI